ncbi:2-dehydropantoate 2-reductase [Rheinheimera pacifica]|uniref:ketopantoate reductase family protein n=1 Tax=Rheinheimera pacifica TaxID=173990 RepID=UPI0021681EA6|nr:2-dehydropantoate 2-reductase [Rheinheimera pacifica]MCS4308669.1 2-dehydropantoate 2-reductase [Rheinheimera pacifica]
MAQHSPPQPALNWAIVGQGAIGLLAASRLQLAGWPVQLWLRQPAVLNIHFEQQALHFANATAPLAAVLIPVKSYAVPAAVQALLPALAPDAQLVLSHNGMAATEHILPLLSPAQGLWFLTTTHGALKQGATVRHTGQGQSVLAPLNPAAKNQLLAVQQAMDIALGPVTLTDNILPFLWHKLAINAVINPLTALNNCSNGELAKGQYQPQINQILKEVCQVAAAAGYPLQYAQMLEKVQQVIQSTAANFSSMQQDILHRRRTEIEAITGYIVEQAARYDIAVPLNTHLMQQVLQLQHLAQR